MKLRNLTIPIAIILFACNQPKEEKAETEEVEKKIYKVAFGSCGKQNHPLPIFYEVIKQNPNLFIFMGDNIYGDTKVMDTLRAKYDRLGSKPSFKHLKENTEILATWDDHDYGWNDAGKEYEFKEESKEIFIDFFNIPDDSEMRNHKGIYHSKMFDFEGKRIHIILLDTRTFRDHLLPYKDYASDDRRYFYELAYEPHTSPDSSMLGSEQWLWLEKKLEEEADIRIIVSSTQFVKEFNGYESWSNFPFEKEKMTKLIKRTKANGVLFISGDVHYGEIAKMEIDGQYPIYDVTSSGLSSSWLFATPNKYRIEGPVMDNHFGLLSFILINEELNIMMEIWDINGNQRVEYTIPYEEISFK